MELLGMLLDVLDAAAGAFAFASVWVTWVRPSPAPPPHDGSGAPDEIEAFLRRAAEPRSSDDACPQG